MTSITWDFDIDKAVNYFQAGMARGLSAMTIDGAALIQNVHREAPRGGKTYRRGKGVVHIASAPGEAPAPDSGRLIGAIFGGEIERSRDMLLSRIVINVEYASSLELGTEKIAARPFIVNTIQTNWDIRLMPLFAAVSRS